jgi:RNA polymerase sigma-70 factor (ECF subfamily)
MADAHNLGPLFDRARGGDSAAWNALLGQIRPFIRTLCRQQVRYDGDASDLTQEVQLRMDRGFSRFRGSSLPQFLAWVRQIAARVLADHHRAGRLPMVSLTDRKGPVSPSTDSRWFGSDELIQLAQALDRLPELYRRVIEGRLVDGLSCVALAERLGRTAGWVRITSMRAIERLHDELGIKP